LRSSIWRVAGALLLALAAAQPLPAFAAPPPYARGLLFRVDAPGRPVSWVFGTMHSNDPRVTRLPAVVREALAASRQLAPEILLAESELPGYFAAAQFDDGRRLADYFDERTLAQILDVLGANAPPPEVFARLKPWALLPMLAQARAQELEPTLDEVLIDDAHRRRMTVIGLELPEEQVASFDAIPVASQVAVVRWTLAHRDRLSADREAAIDAWLARDLERLAALAAAPGRTEPAMAPHLAQLTLHLVDNRSVQMAHRLFLPLREGRVFVAVGALHLYGQNGLLALIRAQGYRIQRVY